MEEPFHWSAPLPEGSGWRTFTLLLEVMNLQPAEIFRPLHLPVSTSRPTILVHRADLLLLPSSSRRLGSSDTSSLPPSSSSPRTESPSYAHHLRVSSIPPLRHRARKQKRSSSPSFPSPFPRSTSQDSRSTLRWNPRHPHRHSPQRQGSIKCWYVPVPTFPAFDLISSFTRADEHSSLPRALSLSCFFRSHPKRHQTDRRDWRREANRCSAEGEAQGKAGGRVDKGVSRDRISSSNGGS